GRTPPPGLVPERDVRLPAGESGQSRRLLRHRDLGCGLRAAGAVAAAAPDSGPPPRRLRSWRFRIGGGDVSYPVTFSVTYEEQRSRLSTFFRLILAIPILIWVWVYALITSIAVVIAWFVMVISASYP